MVLAYILFSERFHLIPFIFSIINIVQFYNSVLYFFNYMRYVLFYCVIMILFIQMIARHSSMIIIVVL